MANSKNLPMQRSVMGRVVNKQLILIGIMVLFLSANALADIPYALLPAGQSATASTYTIDTCFYKTPFIYDSKKRIEKEASNIYFLYNCYFMNIAYNFGKVTYHKKAIAFTHWY